MLDCVLCQRVALIPLSEGLCTLCGHKLRLWDPHPYSFAQGEGGVGKRKLWPCRVYQFSTTSSPCQGGLRGWFHSLSLVHGRSLFPEGSQAFEPVLGGYGHPLGIGLDGKSRLQAVVDGVFGLLDGYGAGLADHRGHLPACIRETLGWAQTRFTGPICSASWASTRHPVNVRSLALPLPTRRGSLWVPPAPGMMASRVPVRPMEALDEAVGMSGKG